MSPTPDQLKAAEETLTVAIKQSQVALNEKLLKAVQDGTSVDYDLDPFIINAIAQLLSDREAKARREGAEKVVKAVRNSSYGSDGECRACSKHGYYDDEGKSECSGAEVLLAAQKALNDLK